MYNYNVNCLEARANQMRSHEINRGVEALKGCNLFGSVNGNYKASLWFVVMNRFSFGISESSLMRLILLSSKFSAGE